MGADDYITKPFDDAELLDAIEIRLQKNDRMRQQYDRSSDGFSAFVDEARGFEELKKLSFKKTAKHYRKKEILFEEGEYPRYLYLVNSGKVKVYKTNEDGKELITKIAVSGDFIGYVDLIKGVPYSESASTLEDADVNQVSKEDFLTLMYANRDVSTKLIKMLANDITEQEEHLLQLAYNSVRKRVADALVLLYDRYKAEGNTEIYILRDDLARLVGTAKESVIRTLADFKDEKLIQIEDGAIAVLNRDKLSQLPN